MNSTSRFSKDLNIDDSLSTDGVDSELSLADENDDFLDVFSGTLAFGEHRRNASLDFETDLPGELPYAEITDTKKGQARVAFEIISANIKGEGRQKYVAYTILVLKGPGINTSEAIIERRYSNFERLHASLRKRFPNEVQGISFPKKMMTGNFKAETIALRSRAFEQYLCHAYTIPVLRQSHKFISFFYEDDLHKAYDYLCSGNYDTAIPLVKTSLLLQQRLQGESHREVIATTCALVVIYAEKEQDDVAQTYAETAFQSIGSDDSNPYLPSLLILNIRLCWKLGKDKKDLEERQQKLKEKGVNIENTPPLINIVKRRFVK